jgi:hypothetical protein
MRGSHCIDEEAGFIRSQIGLEAREGTEEGRRTMSNDKTVISASLSMSAEISWRILLTSLFFR